MASVFQKSLVWLGLVDEDQVAEDELTDGPRHLDSGARPDRPAASRPIPRNGTQRQSPVTAPNEVIGRRVEPPMSARRGTFVDRGEVTPVRPMAAQDATTQVVEVRDFDDAKVLADRIRDREPVVLNLRETSPEMVRRIIDFSTGLTYALDGSMRKIAEGVILVSPPRVSIGRDEKRRLADLGLYDRDPEQ